MQDSEFIRDYAIEDPIMFMHALDMKYALELNLADFQTFDPMFDATYIANWENDINTARQYDKDDYVEISLVQNTEVLDKEMELCRICFQNAKFFIEKAYPGNPQMWKVFGYADYEATRKSPEKMLVFMLVLHEAVSQNATKLATVNFTQTDIDEVLARKSALEAVIISRTLFLRSRSLKTRERILLLNKVWNYLSEVSAASKLIYRNNYPLYQLFLLPESKDADRGIDIKGRVKDASTGENIKGIQAEIASLKLTTTTNAWGFFRFGKLEKGTYAITLSGEGYQNLTVEVFFDGKEMFIGEWVMA